MSLAQSKLKKIAVTLLVLLIVAGGLAWFGWY